MAGMNRTEIIGNIGRVEAIKYLPNGTPVLNFSVAVNQRRGSGEHRTETTTWYRVALWRQLAETMAQFLAAGKQVYIAGTLAPEIRIYTNNSGQPAASYELTGNEITLLGSRDDHANSNGAPEPQEEVTIEDIPF